MARTRFQLVDEPYAFHTTGHDRQDHIWFPLAGQFKCCLCGCVTSAPPPYPTPRDWQPVYFALPLTEHERGLCPNPMQDPDDARRDAPRPKSRR